MISPKRSTVATVLANIHGLTGMTVRIGTLLITIARFPDGINSTRTTSFKKEIEISSVFL
jgi:hypothetical protein